MRNIQCKCLHDFVLYLLGSRQLVVLDMRVLRCSIWSQALLPIHTYAALA